MTNSLSHAMKMTLEKGYVCMNHCDRFKTVQAYEREKDGRIFTCADCKFQVCTDCDGPEHTGETCAKYKQRLPNVHSEAEMQTHKAYKSCTLVETEKASYHTQCDCGYHFCSSCMVNWVGEGSAYFAGKEAHLPGCRYRSRDP